MPFRTIPGRNAGYAMLAFDTEGRERTDPDGANGFLSARIADDLSGASITDVFILSHGWKGDVPAAIDQYDRWISAMDDCASDVARLTSLRQNFRAYRIGVHWPSLPWGDEELGAPSVASFSPMADLVDTYEARLGSRPGLREALERVVAAAAREPDARRLPADAEAAYHDIDTLLAEVGAIGEAGAPGDDREPFDPQTYFEAAREEASFGFGDLGGILAPLRQLSFWKMKQRARDVGEGGMHSFLGELQDAASGRDMRFHLMGHSFGAIVASAMVCGPRSQARRIEPVASMALIQGALSLWSYCDDIPVAPGNTGYFRRLITGRSVAGAIVTTRSVHDTAVGRYYPLGAGVARQVSFDPDELPRYGALGSFGARALVPEASDVGMLGVDGDYGFEAGHIYNLEASEFIRDGSGASGAHNDIDGPEVAHAVLQAASVSEAGR